MKKNTLYIVLIAAIGASILPFLWLFTQIQIRGDFTAGLANIAGLIGATVLVWQFLLGNRTIFRALTPDYISTTKFHMFLGTYGFLLILLHPILETVSYGSNYLLLIIPSLETEFLQHVAYGRTALILLFLLWITSALIRNKLKYRHWQYIHYVSYPLMFLVFIHSLGIGTYLQTFPSLRGYWIFLFALYGLLVLRRILQIFNVGKLRFALKEKSVNPDKVTLYTFTPLGKKKIPHVGQFFYIKSKFFGEAHPFSITEFNETTGELVFGIKSVGKFTNQLENLNKGDTVYIDGPYGVFTTEGQNNQPKIILAGGIGITPFVELIKRFSNSKTYLFYSNKELKNALYRDQFKKELGANYKDIISREKVTREPIIQGHLTKESLETNVDTNMLEKANFFVCGSPAYIEGMKTLLKGMSIPKNRIFIEEFSL